MKFNPSEIECAKCKTPIKRVKYAWNNMWLCERHMLDEDSRYKIKIDNAGKEAASDRKARNIKHKDDWW